MGGGDRGRPLQLAGLLRWYVSGYVVEQAGSSVSAREAVMAVRAELAMALTRERQLKEEAEALR